MGGIDCEEASKIVEEDCKSGEGNGITLTFKTDVCEEHPEKEEALSCIEENEGSCEKITACLFGLAASGK